MENILNFFSVSNIAINLLGYNMSWLELLATVFTIINIYLVIKEHILNFPFAFIAILLSLWLFFQSALYADAILQIYFFVLCVYGWWKWSNGSFVKSSLPVTELTSKGRVIVIAIILILTPVVGICMKNLPHWLPAIFTQPTAYPFSDSFILIASFVGQWLLAQKKTENWWCWIAVNAVAVVIYYLKDLKLFSLLYFILLLMAIKGIEAWKKSMAASMPDHMRS
jgi:nicotinamide mononucleotide transporter